MMGTATGTAMAGMTIGHTSEGLHIGGVIDSVAVDLQGGSEVSELVSARA